MLTKINDNYWLDISIIRRIAQYEDGYECQMDYAHMTQNHFVNLETGKQILKALELFYGHAFKANWIPQKLDEKLKI
jgi:hypothetical protein